MDTFCTAVSSINWLWYVVSIVVVFFTGGIWFSQKVFGNAWMKVFDIKMPAPESVQIQMFLPMVYQIIASAFLGFVLFTLTAISPCLALIVLAAFCGWQKMNLKFKITSYRQFFIAAGIEVGYLFLAGIIFILFAMI